MYRPVLTFASCAMLLTACTQAGELVRHHDTEVVTVAEGTEVAGSIDGQRLVVQVADDGGWSDPATLYTAADDRELINLQVSATGPTAVVRAEDAPTDLQDDAEDLSLGILAVVTDPTPATAASEWAVTDEADPLNDVVFSDDGSRVTQVVEDPETGDTQQLLWQDGAFSVEPAPGQD